LGNAVGRIVSLNFDTTADSVDIRAFLAISEKDLSARWRHYCSAPKENSMLVSDFVLRHGEHSLTSSQKAPP